MIYSGIPAKRRAEPEFAQQSALFSWARIPAVVHQYPGIDLLSCSLNGVKLTKAQAGKAKAAGMLKGEWDVRLPVARGAHIGLAIEMKAGRNKLTAEQERHGERLRQEGWLTAVCYTWEAAKDIITTYLNRAPRGSVSTPLER